MLTRPRISKVIGKEAFSSAERKRLSEICVLKVKEFLSTLDWKLSNVNGKSNFFLLFFFLLAFLTYLSETICFSN